MILELPYPADAVRVVRPEEDGVLLENPRPLQGGRVGSEAGTMTFPRVQQSLQLGVMLEATGDSAPAVSSRIQIARQNFWRDKVMRDPKIKVSERLQRYAEVITPSLAYGLEGLEPPWLARSTV